MPPAAGPGASERSWNLRKQLQRKQLLEAEMTGQPIRSAIKETRRKEYAQIYKAPPPRPKPVWTPSEMKRRKRGPIKIGRGMKAGPGGRTTFQTETFGAMQKRGGFGDPRGRLGLSRSGIGGRKKKAGSRRFGGPTKGLGGVISGQVPGAETGAVGVAKMMEKKVGPVTPKDIGPTRTPSGGFGLGDVKKDFSKFMPGASTLKPFGLGKNVTPGVPPAGSGSKEAMKSTLARFTFQGGGGGTDPSVAHPYQKAAQQEMEARYQRTKLMDFKQKQAARVRKQLKSAGFREMIGMTNLLGRTARTPQSEIMKQMGMPRRNLPGAEKGWPYGDISMPYSTGGAAAHDFRIPIGSFSRITGRPITPLTKKAKTIPTLTEL